uniref:Uncharacterized protein n=1 Tax=Rhizophora mucronata TaxID=61149 RepID=A0A2P2Q7A4_RHIMU
MSCSKSMSSLEFLLFSMLYSESMSSTFFNLVSTGFVCFRLIIDLLSNDWPW